MKRQIRAYIYAELIDEVKKEYPQTEGLSATGLIDWGLRSLIAYKRAEEIQLKQKRKKK